MTDNESEPAGPAAEQGAAARLQDLVMAMAAERAPAHADAAGACGASLLLSLVLAHLLQAGFHPHHLQLPPAAQADGKATAGDAHHDNHHHRDAEQGPAEPAADHDAADTPAETPRARQPRRQQHHEYQQQQQQQQRGGGLRRMRAHGAHRPMPYLRSVQMEQQRVALQRIAAHQSPRRYGVRRAPHPAVVAARAAQVARTRAACRDVADGVQDGARTLRGLLARLLPEGWPCLAASKQYSTLLALPPFEDCSFRLVAAPADWDDVVLVNLSVLWAAPAAATTYSLALRVHDYVVDQKQCGEQRPQLRNVAELVERLQGELSRPASCAARTAHGVVNPSLLGLPLRAARAILARLSAADILAVAACCRALRSLAADAALWRHVVTRDFGPLGRARALHHAARHDGDPRHEAAVDWLDEYRRLHRARSALQIRRPSSDLVSRCYVAVRPLPAADGAAPPCVPPCQRALSLGLIREDAVVPCAAAPPPPPQQPPPPPLRQGPTQPPSLQSFYGGANAAVAAAAPRRTHSSKSTVSRASSVRSARSVAKQAVRPAEEVVRVGGKVYKALVGGAPSPVKQHPVKGCRRQSQERRRAADQDDESRFSELDSPSVTSSRASSTKQSVRSFCRMSSGSRRSSVHSQSLSRKAASSSSAAAHHVPAPKAADKPVLDHPFCADDPAATPRRPRSRPRPGTGLGAALMEQDKTSAPTYQCLGDHRAYAAADDPEYERLHRAAARLRSAPPSTRPSARLHHATTPHRARAKARASSEEK